MVHIRRQIPSISIAAIICAAVFPVASNAQVRENQREDESAPIKIAPNTALEAIDKTTTSLITSQTASGLFTNHFIRGLGNSDLSLNAVPSVSYIVDGVNLGNPVLRSVPIFDIKEIDIIKGSQSAISGHNASSGLIRLNTVSAGSNGPDYINLNIDEAGSAKYTGAIDLPRFGNLDVRIAGLHSDSDYWGLGLNRGNVPQKIRIAGIFHERRRATNSTAGRVQIRYRPNTNVDARVNLHAARVKSRAQIFGGNIRSRLQSANDAEPQSTATNLIQYNSVSGYPQSANFYGAGLTLSFVAGKYDISSVSGYEVIDDYKAGDLNGPTIISNGSAFSLRTPSQEGIRNLTQLTQDFSIRPHSDGNLDWVVGALISKQTSKNYSDYSNSNPPAVLINARQSFTTNQFAVYGSLNYSLSAQTRISGAIRFSDVRRKLREIDLTAVGLVSIDAWKNSQNFDTSVIVNHSLTPNFALYGKLSRDAIAPMVHSGFAAPNPAASRTEYVNSAEFGFRSKLLGDRISIEVSAFNNSIENQHFTEFSPLTNLRTTVVVRRSFAKGYEANFQYAPTRNLHFIASIIRNDTKIQDPAARAFGCTGSCTIQNPIINGQVVIDQNQLPNIPKVVSRIGADYAVPIGSDVLRLSTNWHYRGDTNFLLYKSAELSESGFWQGDIRAEITFGNGKYNLAIFGQNITDSVALVAVSDTNNLTGIYGAPRLFGIEGKVNF
jgi:iron complex outermembrane receptor protein